MPKRLINPEEEKKKKEVQQQERLKELRELAKKSQEELGPIRKGLTSDDWLLLLENDLSAMYYLRGDWRDPFGKWVQNPENVSFRKSDIMKIPVNGMKKEHWLNLIKWDVGRFNKKIEEWTEYSQKGRDKFIFFLRCSLENAYLEGADLSGLNLRGANLSHTVLTKANLEGTNLAFSDLSYSKLYGVQLDEKTTFEPKLLKGTKFGKFCLKDRMLQNCDNAQEADFYNTRFEKVHFNHGILGKKILQESFYDKTIGKIKSKQNDKSVNTSNEIDCREGLSIQKEALTGIFKYYSGYISSFKIINAARNIYINLKTNWSNIGYYDDASWAAIREKECMRKEAYALRLALKAGDLDAEKLSTEYMIDTSIKKWWFGISLRWRWVSYSAFNKLCQYGENPGRLFWWAIGLVFLCAFLYPVSGVNATIGTSPEKQFLSYTHGFSDDIWPNIGRFLYYSVVSFTTAGYGDFHPVGTLSHIVASLEAFFGVFLIGLFIWCLGRRVGAR